MVDALVGLLEDGDVQPTTAAIAARAGVAERTIFQHFPDRDALFLAVAARQTERLTAMWEPLARTGPFEERLDAFVEQRAQILEVVTPVRRGALLMEPFSEAVSNGLAGFRELKRREAERVFEPELDRLSGRERETAWSPPWAPPCRGRPGRSCVAIRGCRWRVRGRRCGAP